MEEFDRMDGEARKQGKTLRRGIKEVKISDNNQVQDSQASDLLPRLNYDKNYKIDLHNEEVNKSHNNRTEEERDWNIKQNK